MTSIIPASLHQQAARLFTARPFTAAGVQQLEQLRLLDEIVPEKEPRTGAQAGVKAGTAGCR